MTPQAEVALRESIQHWERHVAGDPSEAIGTSSCALCRRFWTREGCKGCPVKDKSGQSFCHGTPYDVVGLAHNEWKLALQKDPPMMAEKARLAWVEAATAELNFLKGLLP